MSRENQFQVRTWGIATHPTIYLYDGANSIDEVDGSAIYWHDMRQPPMLMNLSQNSVAARADTTSRMG
ncbi:MAG TPA: hypothetical protein VMP68_13435 [Candidatus Eisenbacteria bacterium]|nr:hypothetical protein [Candidatus Eisenbacteria bacterium]